MVGTTRETTHKSKKRNLRRTKKMKRSRPSPTHTPRHTSPDTPTPPAVIESHRFMSRMTFDGNTLTTQTQRDNEPVIEHKYTKKQLAEEIPIGKEMVDMYLDGKIPKELHEHHRNKGRNNSKRSLFRNVLISPADLGLLPPESTSEDDTLQYGDPLTKKLRMRRRQRQRQRNNIHGIDA